jgi:hypothetical protein
LSADLPGIIEEMSSIRAEMRSLKERDSELRAMVIEVCGAGLPGPHGYLDLPAGASLQAKPAERADLRRLRRALGAAAEEFITPGWHWRIILAPRQAA